MRCFILLMAFACSGCATITRGSTDQIQITSDPQGAFVRTSMGQQCSTPCTLSVGRKDEFSITYSMEGYEPATLDVKTAVAGSGAAGFAGNVLLGGVIGMGVDAATGASLEHVPNPAFMTLQPIHDSKSAQPTPKIKPKPTAPKSS
jgi:PEGA domain